MPAADPDVFSRFILSIVTLKVLVVGFSSYVIDRLLRRVAPCSPALNTGLYIWGGVALASALYPVGIGLLAFTCQRLSDSTEYFLLASTLLLAGTATVVSAGGGLVLSSLALNGCPGTFAGVALTGSICELVVVFLVTAACCWTKVQDEAEAARGAPSPADAVNTEAVVEMS